jgi:hypothetical protein
VEIPVIVTESTQEPVLISEEREEGIMSEIRETDGISRTPETVDTVKKGISKIPGMTVDYLTVTFSRMIVEGKVDIAKIWTAKTIAAIDILLTANIVEKRDDHLQGNRMAACYHPANSTLPYM